MDTITEPVSFISGGEALIGRLVLPAGLPNGRLPAVVIAGGQTCVKEQMAERYAHRLAEHGYAGLAFDFRGFGESGGRPRDCESPGRKVEDLRCALSFLADRPTVDPGRLAALGIGAGATVYRPLHLPEADPLTSAYALRVAIVGHRRPLCVRACRAWGWCAHGRARTAWAGAVGRPSAGAVRIPTAPGRRWPHGGDAAGLDDAPHPRSPAALT